jgi:Domain of unknown function (DUF4262)
MVRMLDELNLDDNDRKLLKDVAEYGWHVVVIPEESGTPGWAFSVGLYQSYQHPEVVVFGLPGELLPAVVNIIGAEVKAGNTFLAGQDYPDILEAVLCTLRNVQQEWYRPFLGYATWYYRGTAFPVLQCIWPDKGQRYPWDAEFKKEWQMQQPLLFEKDSVAARAVELLRSKGDWAFVDPPDVATYTTRQVVNDREPILFLTHDFDDGAWQLLHGGDAQASDAMIVCLSHLIKLDPKLAELADLPLGWQAVRKSVGEPWHRAPTP